MFTSAPSIKGPDVSRQSQARTTTGPYKACLNTLTRLFLFNGKWHGSALIVLYRAKVLSLHIVLYVYCHAFNTRQAVVKLQRTIDIESCGMHGLVGRTASALVITRLTRLWYCIAASIAWCMPELATYQACEYGRLRPLSPYNPACMF